MKQIFHQLIRFSIVGSIGFVIDATFLTIAISFLSLGPYYGRLLSYLIAASSTWFMNRHFTFPGSEKNAIHRQWGKFLGVNALGGVINLGVYTACISGVFSVTTTPVIAVAIGSLVALAFNFWASRRWVFQHRKGL